AGSPSSAAQDERRRPARPAAYGGSSPVPLRVRRSVAGRGAHSPAGPESPSSTRPLDRQAEAAGRLQSTASRAVLAPTPQLETRQKAVGSPGFVAVAVNLRGFARNTRRENGRGRPPDLARARPAPAATVPRGGRATERRAGGTSVRFSGA